MSDTDICIECGGEFPTEHLYYSDDGGMICRQCEASKDAASGLRNAYIGMGTGAISLALISICINVFMIPSILAILAGIQTLRYPSTLSSDERGPIDDLWWVPFLAILALLIGSGKTLLSAVMIFAIL